VFRENSHNPSLLCEQQVFYTLISPFLAFFASFAFLIYPNRDLLHPNAAADWLATGTSFYLSNFKFQAFGLASFGWIFM
jgi:ATP/ADP translocase